MEVGGHPHCLTEKERYGEDWGSVAAAAQATDGLVVVHGETLRRTQVPARCLRLASLSHSLEADLTKAGTVVVVLLAPVR